MRRRSAMQQISMSVFLPSRRKSGGWVAKWRDPTSGRWQQKTLGVKIKRDAYDVAGELAAQIVSGVSVERMTWLEFCGLYEAQHLRQRSSDSIGSWRTTKWYVEKLAPLRSLADATTPWVSRFQEALRRRSMAVNSVATYSARLRAALRWAERQRLIDRAPYVPVEVVEAPRSRAVTGEEFERMLAVAPKVRSKDAPRWDRLLRGQWESGLRISELLNLSWDEDAPIRLTDRGKWPMIHFGRQKNKRRQWMAVTPEFWAVCCETSKPNRRGVVFELPGRFEGRQMTVKRVVRTIAEIGRQARIVTEPETGKTATSHDLRRALAIRLQEQGTLSLPEVSKFLRHAKIETTLTYYDTRGAEEISAKLWGEKE